MNQNQFIQLMKPSAVLYFDTIKHNHEKKSRFFLHPLKAYRSYLTAIAHKCYLDQDKETEAKVHEVMYFLTQSYACSSGLEFNSILKEMERLVDEIRLKYDFKKGSVRYPGKLTQLFPFGMAPIVSRKAAERGLPSFDRERIELVLDFYKEYSVADNKDQHIERVRSYANWICDGVNSRDWDLGIQYLAWQYIGESECKLQDGIINSLALPPSVYELLYEAYASQEAIRG